MPYSRATLRRGGEPGSSRRKRRQIRPTLSYPNELGSGQVNGRFVSVGVISGWISSIGPFGLPILISLLCPPQWAQMKWSPLSSTARSASEKTHSVRHFRQANMTGLDSHRGRTGKKMRAPVIKTRARASHLPHESIKRTGESKTDALAIADYSTRART